MKAVNPFLDHIPRELHEQYLTDLMTEITKLNMAETNKNTVFAYGLIVAFARKM